MCVVFFFPITAVTNWTLRPRQDTALARQTAAHLGCTSCLPPLLPPPLPPSISPQWNRCECSPNNNVSRLTGVDHNVLALGLPPPSEHLSSLSACQSEHLCTSEQSAAPTAGGEEKERVGERTERHGDREWLKGGREEAEGDGVMMNERKGKGGNHPIAVSHLYFSSFISLSVRPRKVGQQGI